MIEGPLLWAMMGSIFTGGIAFGGFKAAINGTKIKVAALEADNKDTYDRMARIETKIDILIHHMEKGNNG